MAAPLVLNGITVLDDLNVTPTASTLDGALGASVLANDKGGINYIETSAVAGNQYGMQRVFAAPLDLTSYKYILLQKSDDSAANHRDKSQDLADGGHRIYLEDGSGNWARYNIYGRDQYLDGVQQPPNFGVNQDAAGRTLLCIATDATPQDSSGTLDLTDIVALHCQTIHRTGGGSIAGATVLGGFAGANITRVVAGEVADPATFSDLNIAGVAPYHNQGEPVAPSLGFSANILKLVFDAGICDGSTTTYFDDIGYNVVFQGSYQSSAILDGSVHEPTAAKRKFQINQSASDYVRIRDSTFSSWDDVRFDVEVFGSTSGTLVVSGCVFPKQVRRAVLGHGIYNSCSFSGNQRVSVTPDVSMSGTSITDQPVGGQGLYTAQSGGDYSSIQATVNDNAGHDITVDPPSDGETYDFSEVTSGGPIKIRNESASNAITVTLNADAYAAGDGVGYTTSTAGGAIAVQAPASQTTYTNADLADGTSILVRNVTAASTLAYVASLSTGSGYSLTMTAGVDYTVGDRIEVRLARKDGTTYYTRERDVIITSAGGGTAQSETVPVVRQLITDFALDGAATAIDDKFDLDVVNDEVDLVVGAPWQMAEAIVWWEYQMTQQTPMEDYWGALYVLDDGSLFNDNDILSVRVDNTTAADAVESTGRRLHRRDKTRPIRSPKTGSGALDFEWREPVTVVATGSGVQPSDITAIRAGLAQEASVQTAIKKAKQAAIL